MCGIAAIVGTALDPGHPGIDLMVAALRHRGPDASGTVRLDGCHLGHARLSILDLAGGAQPMAYAQRYHITFNGEIYNHRELRAELVARGRRFRTRSDTEVILAAFDEWGERCVDRFRGMYAFAIWDARERALYAARDLFGEKPLYYASTPDGGLVIASEIRALRASARVQPRLDRRALDASLALGYVPPDRTVYAGIETLRPAHTLAWRAGRVTIARYWAPRIAPEPMDAGEAAAALRERVDAAVRRQMTADVPVGAFLSGGHDSSTIVALMGRHAGGPVQTFSVGFGTWIDERPYARAVAKRYGTEHHEIDLGSPEAGELLERMARVYDEPFMDPSHIPTFLIAEFARRRVKVVLTGDGADELFGGYAWYPVIAAAAALPGSLLAWLVLRSASRLIGDRLAPLVLYSRALGLAARTAHAWERYVRYRLVFSDEERRRLWGGHRVSFEDWLPSGYYRAPRGTGGFDEALYFDLAAFLPGDILVKVDRAAMAHGLETRAPFLDRDVVELALRMPAALKVSRGRTKIAFRRAFADLWPPELHTRGKQGFAAPHDRWLARPDVAALERRVRAAGSPLSDLLPGAGIGAWTTRQRWHLLSLGLWLEQHAVV